MDVVRRAAAACLTLAPAAHAAFGFQGLSASPTNTSADAHRNFNIHIGFTSPNADVKDLTLGLPPGLVGIRPRRRGAPQPSFKATAVPAPARWEP
jgi:hypothetical protein